VAHPYKIVVWGPGYLGAACIKEILKRPEFELVGVLAYSEAKRGKDVGELLGIGHVGVTATTDQEQIFNIPVHPSNVRQDMEIGGMGSGIQDSFG
jgi:hypothetical protein